MTRGFCLYWMQTKKGYEEKSKQGIDISYHFTIASGAFYDSLSENAVRRIGGTASDTGGKFSL